MTIRTASTPDVTFRRTLALLALLAVGGSPMAAQGIGNAGACATSRARASIDEVGAAMFAWVLDATSGLARAVTAGPALRVTRVGDLVCPGSPPVDVTQVPVISLADLRALLVPQYIAAIPANDPWEHPYDYRLNLANPLDLPVVAVRSAGADGQYEGTVYDIGTTSGPDEDLVLFNTTRVRQPPHLDPVSRQEVTVERIDRLGAAMLSYWTDVISGAPRTPGGGPAVDLSLITPISAADLAAVLLTPFYTLCVPAEDGWGHPFDLRMNDNPLVVPFMSIRSPGRDGTVEGDLYDTELFPADDLDRDLVWSDGQYYQSPTATRTQIFTDNFESATLWGTWTCGPGF